ncbi:hypothetical protein O3P69_001249 [Scylla paramamosain]|uniref:Uncharacterized protein n=1 Tax=Scylla paramamosain TaxID=85552 RepID=A0AAW0UPF6_SCYPA
MSHRLDMRAQRILSARVDCDLTMSNRSIQESNAVPDTSPHTGGVDMPCEHPFCASAPHSPLGDIRMWTRRQEGQCFKCHRVCHHHPPS